MKNLLFSLVVLFISYISNAQTAVASYPFTGNANDVIGTNHGTVNGATLTTDRFGNANSAYSFDGVDDLVDLGNSSTFQFANQLTVSTWFKTSLTSGNSKTLVSKWFSGGTTPNGGTFSLSYETNGLRVLLQNQSGQNLIAQSNAMYNDNVWRMTTFTWDGTNLRLFINGVQVAMATNATFGPLELNNRDVIIGSDARFTPGTGDRHFPGSIDEVKIYSTALTGEQVASEYSNSNSNGLVASYPFTGNAIDAVGSNNGTVNGATLTTDRFGNANSAYSFDGVNDFVSTANLALTQTDNWTMMAWVKPASLSQAGVIVSNGFDNASSGNGYSMAISNGGGGAGNVFTGLHSGVAWHNSGGVFATNNSWYHLVMIRQSGVVRYYINGVQTANTTTNNVVTPTSSLRIGSNTGIRFFDGAIDDIKIYNTALTSTQVQTEYANYSTQFNNSALMNGTNDYMLVPNNPSLNFTSEITVEAWVYPTSYPSQYPSIIAKHNAASSFELDLKNDNTIEWECFIGGQQRALNAGPIALNQWTHITALYNGTAMKIYKNGIEVASLPVTGAIGTNSLPVEIGSRSGGGALFSGKLDEVRIWNIARTPAQITNAMNAELVGNESGLVAYWDMNRNGQGAGLVVDNKATITGTALHATTFGTANTPFFSALNTQILKPGSGNALAFDGTDDFVEMPNVLHGLSQTTIEFWVKTTENRTSGLFWQKPTLIGNANPGAPDGDFGITTNNGQIGIWSGVCTCGDQALQTTTSINDNQWHHVAAINNGTIIQLYVDGIVVGSIPSTGGMGLNVNGRPLYLGASNSCCSGINAHAGSMDEIRFWNIALSESQLRDRMCRKITNTDALYSNLVNYNNADETSGNTLYDGSANGNHKTLQGGVARTTSGAPIGNTSTHNYVNTGFPSANLNVNAEDNFAVAYTAGTYAGTAGTHIYSVNEKPTTENGITVLGSNDRYFGVFNANLTTPQYTATYNYTGNANAITSLENFLSLYKRNDNATSTWTNSSATLNTTVNTLSVTGQNTEYMLGLNPSNQVLKPGSGNAISFDGVDDVIDIPNNSAINFTLNQNFTVECWAKIPSTLQSNEATEAANSILEKWNGVAGGYPYVIRYRNGNNANLASIKNKIEVARWNGANYVSFHSIVSVNDNKFHHISFIKNGTVLSLYIDGVFQSSATDITTGATDNPDPLHIGGRTIAQPLPLNGTIDEVRIWNTALTVAQIRDRMCKKIISSDPLYSNLVAYYNFDETTGTTAFDGTVNTNNGTLTNNPTRVTSGAAIGNTSTHNYVTTGLPAANLSSNAQDNLAIAYTAGTYTGEAGTHIYAVNEKPNSETGINGVGTNDRYFGVFNANLTAPTYTSTYNYNNNPFVNGTNESLVALYKRNDNATSSWAHSLATLNTTANTLTVAGQSTEYMLGLDTVVPFVPTNVMVTDGTNTFVSTPNGMMQGALNFTLETWIKTTENKSNGAFYLRPTIIGNGRSSSSDNDVAIFTNNGSIGMYSGLGGENVLQTAVPINNNQWHHIALVRVGTTLNLYVDGINVGNTVVGATQTLITSDAPLTIGGCAYNFGVPGINTVNISAFHQGEYAETRFSNTARYTANFIPTNSYTTDANTVALYHYGTCQREQCVDATTNNNFLRGRFSSPTCSPVLPFAQAVTYDGINQGATLPTSLMNGLTSFTIEGWIKSTDMTTSPSGELWRAPWIFGKENPAGASGDIMITTQAGYANITTEFIGGSYGETLTKYFISDNQWHHVAVSADGTNCRYFIDGILLESKAVNSGLSVSGADKFALMNRTNTNESSHSGMMDEVRFSNSARYLTNFIPPTSVFTSDANTVALYHSDDCSNITLFDSSSNNNHATFQNMIINCGGGIISANQNSCTPIIPNPLTGTPAFGNEPAIVYQWQDSIVGGIWTNISGATNGASYAPPLLNSPKYIRRLATLSSVTNISNEIFLDIYNAINPSIVPINAWNLYAYDGASVDSVGVTYKGSYTRTTKGFNTITDFGSNGNPSMALGYNGCPLNAPGNTYSLYAKRKGFTTGSYVINIPSHDDVIKIFKDGQLVISAGCCNTLASTFFTLGTLDANTILECRLTNSGGGPGSLNFVLTEQNLTGGTIGSNQTNCGSFIPSLLTNTHPAYGGATTTITYQWQESTDNINFTNINGASSLTYQPTLVSADKYFRRKAMNANNEEAFSNTVFMDITGLTFYADLDGDGFGDPNNFIQACSQPNGYLMDNTDCNDNDTTERPGQQWYIDNDNDGYCTRVYGFTPLVQCNRPAGGKVLSELIGTPFPSDCNDNDATINPVNQYMTFSGTTNYTNSIVFPLQGDPTTTYFFDATYFDVNNNLPIASFPRVLMDFENNALFNGILDKTLMMIEFDPTDQTTSDGKRYVASITGLPAGSNWNSYCYWDFGNICRRFISQNAPDVLLLPDLQIFATDISFDNQTPEVSSPLTVTVEVKNESDFATSNVVVHLVNQADLSAVYPDITIPNIPPQSSFPVSWNITTPALLGICPMQVTVDYTNVITEPNELDNTAVASFNNGNAPVSGGIIVEANVAPLVSYASANNTLHLNFNATFSGGNLPPQLKVAGAPVSFQIIETGAVFTGFTNTNGHIDIPFTAPLSPGEYHIAGTITSFPYIGDISPAITTFTLLAGCKPDYTVHLDDITGILVAGESRSMNVIVKNEGCVAATDSSQVTLSMPGCIPDQLTIDVPPLAVNATHSLTSPIVVQFPNPGSYNICAQADVNIEVDEINEANNQDCVLANALANGPDLVSSQGSSGAAPNCSPRLLFAQIKNNGGAASTPCVVQLRIKQGNTIVHTINTSIPSIPPLGAHSYTELYMPSNLGDYTVELDCDFGNQVIEIDEGNNILITTIGFTICAPDLTPTGCNVSTSNNDYTSGNMTVNASFANEGVMATSSPITIRFKLSNNTFHDVVYTNPVAVNEIVTVVASIPALVNPALTLNIEMDPLNAIAETYENNNEIVSQAKFVAWDFFIGTSGMPCNPYVYGSGTNIIPSNKIDFVFMPVINNQLHTADTVEVNYKVTGPGIIGQLDLGTFNVFNVNKGCGACGSFASLVTAFLYGQLGTYVFTVTVDPNNKYPESNESNNVRTVTVLVKDDPDMFILQSYISPSLLNPALGEPITVNVTYANKASSNLSDQMKLKLFIDNVAIDSALVSGLAINTNTTVNFSTPWSSNLAGVHVIKAVIDSDNGITEVNEMNNEATRAITVGSSANLLFSELSTLNVNPILNDSITIKATILNEGDLATNADIDFYYVNNNLDTLVIHTENISVVGNDSLLKNIKWKVVDNRTTIVAKIRNSTTQEYNYNDNRAILELGSLKLYTESLPACLTNNKGKITTHVVGGEPPYNYSWSNGSINQQILDVSGNYSVTVIDFTGQQVTANDSIPVCIGGLLYVKCLMQGYYAGNAQMSPALIQSGLLAPLSYTDTVEVELRATSSGFPVSSIFKGIIHNDGTINCHIPLSEIGTNKYIVIIHRNHVQTWSTQAVPISNNITYDFTTNFNKAYGDNMVEVEPGIWAFYSGDINQDGAIDAFDYVLLDPDVISGASGYLDTDLNGDGSVDAFDYLLLDTNLIIGAGAITP